MLKTKSHHSELSRIILIFTKLRLNNNSYIFALDYRQSCSGNKDFFRAYCQSCSGKKRENKSNCQSRNGLIVMCMRVRWAIFFNEHFVDIAIVSDTHGALVSFFDLFRRSWRGNCDNIDPQSCSGNKGGKTLIAKAEIRRAALVVRVEKILIARAEMDWW